MSFNDGQINLNELAGTDSCPPKVIPVTVLINRTRSPLLNKGELLLNRISTEKEGFWKSLLNSKKRHTNKRQSFIFLKTRSYFGVRASTARAFSRGKLVQEDLSLRVTEPAPPWCCWGDESTALWSCPFPDTLIREAWLSLTVYVPGVQMFVTHYWKPSLCPQSLLSCQNSMGQDWLDLNAFFPL